ncbi:hypothetical protein [Streptomyces sp. NPDC048410]|uniref:hypothetical protein n=1 Tax=Streptomyces sp. NPDC048410 TaxID=3365545 RepID=UPI00371360A3
MTESPGAIFPTFCHISDYGERGYQDLHHLVALSQPLNLWAPSSVLIRQFSRITPKEFIRYVDQGFIRVIARDEWLRDQRFRDAHPWPHASWDAEIDDALRSIMRNDEAQEESVRRVLSAPPAEGEAAAVRSLTLDPRQVAYWNKAFRSKDAERKIPVGILTAARRQADGGEFEIAKMILRAGYNHGAAFDLSGATLPLFLSPSDPRFIRLINHAPAAGEGPGGRPPASTAEPSQQRMAELAGQLIQVLHHLDIHAGPRSLDAFIAGEGRQELVAWINAVCEQYRYHPSRDIDGLVIRELREQLGRARLRGPLGRLSARGSLPTVVGVVDLVATAADFVHSPGQSLNTVGMAAGVFSVGNGLAQQMGWLPSTFDGPQWPFLYAYSSRAKKSRLRRMIYALSMYRP